MANNVPWRTETVVQMCRAIRQSGDYTALPILADALQDADYPVEEMLNNLRNYHPDKKDEHNSRMLRALALLESEETAAALTRIDEIADEFEWESSEGRHKFKDMIHLGYSGVFVGGMYFNTTNGPEYFWDKSNLKEFYEKWSLITGIEVSDEIQREMSFACSC